MKKIALTLLITLLPLTAIAETLYVSDTLRVGIRTQPNNNVPSIAVVKSGVAVEVLKRKGSYIQIRTKSGVEGWVKGAYFSRKAPASQKLKVAQGKIKKLEKEIKQIQAKSKTAVAKEDPKLLQKVADLEKANQSLQNEVAALKSRPATQTAGENILSIKNINENVLYAILGILVVLLCLGFLFGVSWHKNQVAKRLGGMSI